jgi:hypothetical protein
MKIGKTSTFLLPKYMFAGTLMVRTYNAPVDVSPLTSLLIHNKCSCVYWQEKPLVKTKSKQDEVYNIYQ